MIRTAYQRGVEAALLKHGLAQPSLPSVGIMAKGLPRAGKAPDLSTPHEASHLGATAAKMAFNVGMGASTSSSGAGAVRGEPADEGRRQRSVIDRTFQANEDNHATSSMPMPGGWVSP